MRGGFIAFFIFGIIQALHAQWSDTTRALDVRDKRKFILNLDARRQQVDGRIVRFFGFRAGVQHRRDIYALGLYGLGDPLMYPSLNLTDIGVDSAELRAYLGYVSSTYERILLDTRRWQLSVPVMAGLGEARMHWRQEGKDWAPYRTTTVLATETGARAAFKIFFWLYLQGGAGYRKVFSDIDRVNEDFSGLTWNFGLSIKFGKIYKYARDKIDERRERKRKEHGSS